MRTWLVSWNRAVHTNTYMEVPEQTSLVSLSIFRLQDTFEACQPST